MRIACLQMDVRLNRPAENRVHAEEMIRAAVRAQAPDVVVLPETWNLGFAPNAINKRLADTDGVETTQLMARLSKELSVHIVAGSVVNRRENALFNTALVFDRAGKCVASYDKTHLFSPMGEDKVFEKGDHLARFTLDGVSCAIIVCYDLRFSELIRTLALPGLDLLFVVSEWPDARIPHLRTLSCARAIENQMFVALCNACGTAEGVRYGGNSAIFDPLGETLTIAGSEETTICAELDREQLCDIRARIPVFNDRRPALYRCDK